MKKFKDCSKEEVVNYCTNSRCATCELSGADEHMCLKYFVTHKDLLSDKALNIELPINNEILNDTEKEFLTQIVEVFNKMHCKAVSFVKHSYSDSYYISFRYISINEGSISSALPVFKSKEMYKGMELDKKYTLEELGIEVPKRKMTIEEFFASKEKLVVHPGSEANAKALCNAFDKKGQTWCNGERYIKDNKYDDYGDKTCYNNNGEYGDISYYKSHSYKIIEFDDVDLS
ncbi:MAG: hypothetical protein M0R51_15270 [Clostridia bacterium]|jgi:hypothetical protein|nr:hypothetical protein [Clostridia bacterium]